MTRFGHLALAGIGAIAAAVAFSPFAQGQAPEGTVSTEAVTPGGATGAFAEAVSNSLRALWPEIQKRYPYLGSRGLLVVVEVGWKVGTPASSKAEVQGAYIVGAGDNPAEALAVSDQESRASYVLSKDQSWFLWITPSSRGFPSKPPSYDAARAQRLLDKKVNYGTVIEDAITIRSKLISDAGFMEWTWLSAMERVAKAAEVEEKTSELRGLATKLERTASQARVRLTEINNKLAQDLERVARAGDALKILDGVQLGLTIGKKVAENWEAAMQFLDGDAPTPHQPIDNETKARQFIVALQSDASKESIGLQEERASLLGNVRTNLDAFVNRISIAGSLIPRTTPKD